MAWKCYYERLLNVENAWNIELSYADTSVSRTIQVDSNLVDKMINSIEKG